MWRNPSTGQQSPFSPDWHGSSPTRGDWVYHPPEQDTPKSTPYPVNAPPSFRPTSSTATPAGNAGSSLSALLALAVLVGGFFALQIGGEFYKRLTTGHPLQSKGVSHGWTVFEASDLVAQSPLKHPMYGLLLTGNVLIRGDVHGLALETPGANLQFAGSVTNSWIFVGRGSFAARNLSNSTVLAPTIVTGSVVNSALTVQSLTTHGPVDSKTTIDRVVWLARFPTNVYKGRRPNEMRSHP